MNQASGAATAWLDAPPTDLDASVLTLARVAGALAVPEQTLTEIFPDVGAYLLAVQQQLFARRLDAIVDAAAALPKGRERMRRAVDTYLDFTIKQHRILIWLRSLADRFPALVSAEQRRVQAGVTLAETEFRAIGVGDPLTAARALITLLVTVARIETEAETADTGWRERLYSTLDSLCAPDRGGDMPTQPRLNA